MSREVSVAQGCNGQLTEDRIPGKDCEDEPESQTLEKQSEQEREDEHQGSDKTRRGSPGPLNMLGMGASVGIYIPPAVVDSVMVVP
ncbi:hypothetical protein G5714_002552 [Onychostoma macrolepis]|uniref:Uncharacterized protein n=1 Tax=Onychostoma macrolepis TaxID=369639 RepID=A0A7J6D716_9TELE|nr:hypothetical protein G5714_002552 [Onychostoma macrolepis]